LRKVAPFGARITPGVLAPNPIDELRKWIDAAATA
jgi:hypothetical protein